MATPESPKAEPQSQKRNRSGDPAAVQPGDSSYKRIHIPEFCLPAIAELKRELGFVDDRQVIPWLLEQIRFPQTTTVNLVPRPISPPDGGGSSARQSLSVRVTVVQASTVVFDTPSTLVKAEQLIRLAAGNGSQLIVFPEAFVGGYPRFLSSDGSGSKEGPPPDCDDRLKYHASAVDLSGPEVERLATMAAKHQVNMVMGVVERNGTNLYSTMIFFDLQGKVQGSHRKSTTLHSESPLWSPGEPSSSLVLPLYATSSAGRIGGLLSSDNRLPLLRSKLYKRGIEIYCAPTADATEVWKASMTHIAMEGKCFVLSANQFCRRRDYHRRSPGNDDAVVSPGGSVIVSPRGEIMEGPHYHGEYALTADLDFAEIERAKAEFGGGVDIGLRPNPVSAWMADATAAAMGFPAV